MVSVPARRCQVAFATGRGLSQRRACPLVKVGRLALRYRSRKVEKDAPLLARMTELVAQYPRYGYRRVRIFLGRDGHTMSFGRAYRGKRRINRGRSSQVERSLMAGGCVKGACRTHNRSVWPFWRATSSAATIDTRRAEKQSGSAAPQAQAQESVL